MYEATGTVDTERISIKRDFGSAPPAHLFRVDIEKRGRTTNVRYFVDDTEVLRDDFRAIQEVCR